MTTGPIGIDLPGLRRSECRWPSRRVISSRAVTIAGEGSVARRVIVPSISLVVTGVTRTLVLVLHRPDSSATQRDIIPDIVTVRLPVRTVRLIQGRGRLPMRLDARVGFFQPRREIKLVLTIKA